jgi:hypothetical protein
MLLTPPQYEEMQALGYRGTRTDREAVGNWFQLHNQYIDSD